MTLLRVDEDYPSIRRALSVRVDAASLPDVVIGDTVYAGAAEAWVASAVPSPETQPEPTLTTLRTAAILYCASLIAPAMPDITAQTWGPLSATQRPIDWRQRAVELAGRANLLLAGVIEGVAEETPVLFTLAHASRGR